MFFQEIAVNLENKKRYINIKSIVAIICVVLILIFSIHSVSYGKSYQVDDLIFLPTGAYLPEVHKALCDAKESIYVVMYLVSRNVGVVTNPLVKDLIDAHKRGVKIKVILDDLTNKKMLNEKAYRFLLENNIDVAYDTEETMTHTKLIIVDHYTTILGSHNWSASAFSFNAESSVLIKSRAIASEFIQHINSIKTEERMAWETSAIIGSVEEIYLQMAHSYYEHKMYDQAIEQLMKIIKWNPKIAETYYYLALSYEKKGEKDKAIENLEKTVEVNPNSSWAQKAKTHLKELKSY